MVLVLYCLFERITKILHNFFFFYFSTKKTYSYYGTYIYELAIGREGRRRKKDCTYTVSKRVKGYSIYIFILHHTPKGVSDFIFSLSFYCEVYENLYFVRISCIDGYCILV